MFIDELQVITIDMVISMYISCDQKSLQDMCISRKITQHSANSYYCKTKKNNNKQVQYKKAISNITVFFQTLNTINVPTINNCFLHIVFISFLTFL